MHARCRSASCTSGRSGSCITCSASAPAAATNSSCSSGNNEQFIDAFWAAILGASCPCRALGISDEHRHKLLRIARRLGEPFLYTERALARAHRHLRAQRARLAVFELRKRTFLVDDLDDISRAGSVQRAQPTTPPSPVLLRLHHASPRVVLTHGNIHRQTGAVRLKRRFNEHDVSRRGCRSPTTWGLIAFSPGHDRQPGALAPHAHGTVHPPPTLCSRSHPGCAPRSCARRTSVTNTNLKVLGERGGRDWTCARDDPNPRATRGPHRRNAHP